MVELVLFLVAAVALGAALAYVERFR